MSEIENAHNCSWKLEPKLWAETGSLSNAHKVVDQYKIQEEARGYIDYSSLLGKKYAPYGVSYSTALNEQVSFISRSISCTYAIPGGTNYINRQYSSGCFCPTVRQQFTSDVVELSGMCLFHETFDNSSTLHVACRMSEWS